MSEYILDDSLGREEGKRGEARKRAVREIDERSKEHAGILKNKADKKKKFAKRKEISLKCIKICFFNILAIFLKVRK